jgi:hypothetical protein
MVAMKKPETHIQRFYRMANRRYWHGRLPLDVKVRWDAKLYAKERAIGIMQSVPGVGVLIVLSTKLRCCAGLVGLVMLHEMAHLAILARAGNFGAGGRDSHGAAFQREMVRLAKAGAFKNLW